MSHTRSVVVSVGVNGHAPVEYALWMRRGQRAIARSRRNNAANRLARHAKAARARLVSSRLPVESEPAGKL